MPRFDADGGSERAQEDRYVHPKTLDNATAKRAARHMIDGKQGFAMIPDGERWKVVGPLEDAQIILDCIKEAKDL